MSGFTIIPFDYKLNADEIFSIYNEVLADKWPVTKEMFYKVLVNNPYYEQGDHLIIKKGNETCGFIASQISTNKKTAEIMLIIIKKNFQKKGLGKQLLTELIKKLKNMGVEMVQLGGGVNTYFWPGVPINLPNAISFFQRFGFKYLEESYDLIRDLSLEYQNNQVNINNDIDIKLLKQQYHQLLLSFEKKYFPNWYNPFLDRINTGSDSEILIGIQGNEIVSSLILFSINSKFRGHNFVWENLLGSDMGGFACVGVRDDVREKGIGIAMVISANKILKELGVKKSIIGWTWLTDWYAKVGYKVWQTYKMSWKSI